MVIQRSTLEFLIITLVLGSIMAATLWLGHGAGVLFLIGWGVAGFIYLKRKGKRDTPRD
ncbi:hypothetical protein SR882_08200 [Guyparkeria halophila]|uniref:LPXTG cell wall anchor domain-containing protein n=1 Tax=Guyparkeria halophila TaxID=47960 RepID=A0ABZ0YX20_9GAMM|nr:hypothetical protein [Guyparkeria halophila]WQH15740.1 hypothetical protein SR882_08200 [Guyparkeria halophila]